MPFESIRGCSNCRRRTVVYIERAALPGAEAALEFDCRACGHRNSGAAGILGLVSRVPAASTIGWISAAQRLPQPAEAAQAPAVPAIAAPADGGVATVAAPPRTNRFTNKPKKTLG